MRKKANINSYKINRMPSTEKKQKLLEYATKNDPKQNKTNFLLCKNNGENINNKVTNFFHYQFFEIAEIRGASINC